MDSLCINQRSGKLFQPYFERPEWWNSASLVAVQETLPNHHPLFSTELALNFRNAACFHEGCYATNQFPNHACFSRLRHGSFGSGRPHRLRTECLWPRQSNCCCRSGAATAIQRSTAAASRRTASAESGAAPELSRSPIWTGTLWTSASSRREYPGDPDAARWIIREHPSEPVALF